MTPRSLPALHLRCRSPHRVKWVVAEEFIDVRCRQCEGCFRVRQWHWLSAAAHEQAFAKSTWFITLTYRPAVRATILNDASALRVGAHAPAPQSRRLVQASGRHVAKYFKRLRKAGFQVRYLCVPEPHRDGFPHWHGLVHDQAGTLTWEALTDEWTAGFSVVKIVRDANAMRYVTKYLAKANYGRVRASKNYGAPEQREASTPPSEEGGPQTTLAGKNLTELSIPCSHSESEENVIPSFL